MSLTPADQRAVALLRQNGAAIAVAYRGYWLCGGSRVAQHTIARLRRAGLVDGTRTKVCLTLRSDTVQVNQAAVDQLGLDVYTEARDAIDYRERGIVDEADEAAPDFRDQFDRPIPLDRVFEED